MEPVGPSARRTSSPIGRRHRHARRAATGSAVALLLSLGVLLSGCTVGGITSIATGVAQTCAVSGGKVLCWGLVPYGDGTPIAEAQVAGPEATGLTDAIQVTIGDDNSYGYPIHVCALRSTGAVVCWGDNAHGQLGDGTTTDRLVPTPVSGLTDAVQISAAGAMTCARRATGAVSCWGRNDAGQLGNGTFASSSAPVTVSGVTDAVDLDVDTYTACAVRSTGSVACWGYDGDGRLGNNDGVFANLQSTPTTVWGVTGATKVEFRQSNVCAIAGGQVACWGRYIAPDHQNAMMTLNDPAYVIPGSAGAIDLMGGGDQACLITATGSVRCWGHWGGGGDGTDNPYSAATDIGLTDVTALAEVHVHPTCVLVASGEARCWGYNTQRALGVDAGNWAEPKVLTPVTPILGAG